MAQAFVKRELTRSRSFEQLSLAKIISDLEVYYKGHDINSFNEFRAWALKNEKELLTNFKADLQNGAVDFGIKNASHLNFVFGFWLGGKFVVSTYKLKNPVFPKITFVDTPTTKEKKVLDLVAFRHLTNKMVIEEMIFDKFSKASI
ncbi:MAG: hypothetical protein NT157_02680 [Candidatus Micrarchaeota archaeon]|nr:hypothetical protein [Candidatus Micrarchaeota archaeon]